jgi:CMP-N,N'-diacetyllegionaminic acid synthase
MIVGLITARGGSKSIKRKNLVKLDQIPLISYTIRAALSSNLDKVYLSTEDQEIIDYASTFPGIHILRRPKELATDTSKSLDVVKHAIESLNLNGDDICLLQPTSPLRGQEDINEAIEKYKRDISQIKSLVSVVKLDHNFTPDSLMVLNSSGYLSHTNESNKIYRRQDKPEYFARNGAAIYIFNSDNVKDDLLTGNIIMYEMSKIKSIDIDSLEDLQIAELYFSMLK